MNPTTWNEIERIINDGLRIDGKTIRATDVLVSAPREQLQLIVTRIYERCLMATPTHT